ncbi:MAG TPA: hypothetical protein VLW49_10675 [Gaiellaceae bacterium]|nr:hypothetical protein [Gaiellaceae bacterium]
MGTAILVRRRFRGPAVSGNGGYTCGLIAELVDGDAVEVTLRLPPPLETPLAVKREGETVLILDGDALVAEARPADVTLEWPEPPSFAEAERLSTSRPVEADHPFPGCFVCGTGREPGDALCLRPAPLGDGRVVAPWRVDERLAGPGVLPLPFAWASLDCPGGWAVQPDASRGVSVLGRLTARVDEPPSAGDECVVVGWPLGADGRRMHAGTALFRGRRLLAIGRAVWFEMGPEVRDR